jgi:hypothetical protein
MISARPMLMARMTTTEPVLILFLKAFFIPRVNEFNPFPLFVSRFFAAWKPDRPGVS